MRHKAKGLIGKALPVALLACMLGGCGQSAGEYPNVYSGIPGKPLTPGPGGGLWSPMEPSGGRANSAMSLYTYLPKPPPVAAPGNAVDTSDLMTPAQVAQVEAERALRGAEAAEAMKLRLLTQGRVNR